MVSMKGVICAATLGVSMIGGRAAQAAQPLNVGVFAGGLSWPIYVAEDRGFFAKNGLDVTVTAVQGSVPQIEGLMSNKYDIIMTPFDNVVAYQEGQGEISIEPTPDLFAFMGGILSSLRMETTPDIRTFADLKGRTLGIDAEHTGYTLAMYELLARHGVAPGDYKLDQTGGTTFRVKALIAGKIAGTMVSSPQEIPLEEKGFRRLGDVQAMIGPYQAVSGVARRSWAATNPDKLRAFIRAYIEASDWMGDPSHRQLAVEVYLHHIPNTSADVADKAWDMMVVGKEGFEPKAKFNSEGAAIVLQIRTKYGRPHRTLHNWTKYVDEGFYREVTAQMK